MTLTGYVDNSETRLALHRRTLSVVMASQVFSGAGLAAGVTVGALLAEQMLGASALSGLPAALYTGGSAAAALAVGRLSQRLGRRMGLAAGYAAGALGGAGVVAAAALDSVVLLLTSLLVYGAGTATNLQARYAGADLSSPGRRGRAVSSVLVTTTVGAVIGPNLIASTGRAAEHFGLPALAGPFALAAIAYALAGTILFLLLRPDPLLISRTLHAETAATASASQARGVPAGVIAGAATMILTQLVMVAVMTMTPIHMQAHGHDLAATGLVISLHIAAMYLPSLVTGILVDRLGRVPVAVASGVTLLAAGLVSATAPDDSVPLLALALILLGLGWNLGLVSGTAMITDAAPVETRAKIQGTVDLCIALAGATGGIASGLVMTATSYAALSITGGVLALGVIPFVLSRTRRAAA
ncbi:Major Facilitator Superfamily protein [Micromonospora viridifaciens]|uniref:Major Facilitator Superfamily protein n=1 Tax=Micromonospora viridifaciens TaxID=1881 RepID=A0A1C4YIR7_MICVI|nr:MFS transporter [Micromonospora viridifaciens]SCF20645.1 Major Facilitator Superfamily protein [Micromonospora viridifaciens]